MKTPEEIKAAQLKQQATCMAKYGVPFYSQSQDFRDKMAKSMARLLEKRKKTCLEKYGVENFLSSEAVKEQTKATNMLKYGVDNQLKRPETKEKLNQKLNAAGVDNPIHLPGAMNKRNSTNQERYGVNNVLANKEINKKAQKTKIKHGYTKVYEGKTVTEWAEEKDISTVAARSILENYGVKFFTNYTKHFSSIEQVMQLLLNKNNIIYQNQGKIDRCKPDFVIDDGKLVIEVDGLYFHSDECKTDDYHVIKKESYTKNGYNSLFFRNDELQFKLETVESIILNNLDLSKNKLHSSNCQVDYVKAGIAEDFFVHNSLSFNSRGITIGLFYETVLVCAIQFYSKGKGIYDIQRMAQKNFYNVEGGFAAIIKFFESEYNPNQLNAIIDLRYESGEFLKQIGFNYINTFKSYRWTDRVLTYNKSEYLKDSGYEQKLLKIWDCGNEVYKKMY